MEQCLILGFLGINSWIDIRRREISLRSVGLFALVGILYECFYVGDASLMFLGFLPGLVLLVVSKVTRDALGMGDALLMLVLGIYLGLEETVNVLLMALMLAAGWAGILLFVGKKKRDYEFPFVPFLLLGYLGVCLWIS